MIIPTIGRMSGNRWALDFARFLSKQVDEVKVVVHTLPPTLLPLVRDKLGSLDCDILRVESVSTSPIEMFHRQFGNKMTREIVKSLEPQIAQKPPDVIFLVGNECHSLGRTLCKLFSRRLPGVTKPILCVAPADLPDNALLLETKSPSILRGFLRFCAYPFVNLIQKWSFRSFDFVIPNSPWTKALVETLYEISCTSPLILLDDETFDRPLDVKRGEYIAVATSDLDTTLSKLVSDLHESGVPIVAFGPDRVGSVPYVGYLSEQDLVRLIAGARATLFLFNYEALGMLPIESLALGTPVICTRRQGPHALFSRNKFVTLCTNEYLPIYRACMDALSPRPDSARIEDECRSTVQGFMGDNAVTQLLNTLDLKASNHLSCNYQQSV